MGSLILSGVLAGPTGFFAAPVMAFFGWPFLIPESVWATIQWYAYSPRQTPRRIVFLAISAALAAIIVSLIGPKEQGSELRWAIGYAVGAGAAAIVSGLVVQFFRHIES